MKFLSSNELNPPTVKIELPGESGMPEGTMFDLTTRSDWFDYEAGSARLLDAAETHEAFFLAHETCKWLHSAVEEPFFLRVDPWGPHPPYVVPEPFLGNVDPEGIELPENFFDRLAGRPAHHAAYAEYWERTLGLSLEDWRLMAARAVEHTLAVETALTRILDTLDQLGLTERTHIIFCADHGDAVASNGRVSNKGGLMVEETMRIPLLWAGPDVPAGAVTEGLVTNMDIVPTLLEVCGIEQERVFHGRSLTRLLQGKASEWRDVLMAQHYGLHERLVQRAAYHGQWKYVVQEDGFEEFYDLANDPFELKNLAHAEQSKGQQQFMRDALISEMDRTGDLERAILDKLPD